MKKHSKSSQRSGASLKRTKSRGPMQRDAKEVMAEVLEKLTGKLGVPAVSTSAKANRRGNTVKPNHDRLTVGVDLGDRWSQYCISNENKMGFLALLVRIAERNTFLRNISLRCSRQES